MTDDVDDSSLHPGSFTQYVIYDHPRDHPDHFVVRPWDLDLATHATRARRACGLFSDLDKARAYCAQFGLGRLERMEGDDPAIVETWL